MRLLVFIALLTLVGLIYFAVVLRLPSARSMLTTLLRVGWLWVGLVIVLGMVEAWRRWA